MADSWRSDNLEGSFKAYRVSLFERRCPHSQLHQLGGWWKVVGEIHSPNGEISSSMNSAPKGENDRAHLFSGLSSTFLCLFRLLSPLIDKLSGWLPINGMVFLILEWSPIARIRADWKRKGISVHMESLHMACNHREVDETRHHGASGALDVGWNIDDNWHSGQKLVIAINRNECNGCTNGWYGSKEVISTPNVATT